MNMYFIIIKNKKKNLNLNIAYIINKIFFI